MRDVIGAIGGLAAMFAVLLDREGVASTDEIAGHLALFAAITDETAPVSGAILAHWSDVIGQVNDPGYRHAP